MPAITCADCGHEYKTIRKNTKYCRICRLVRNLDFLQGTVYQCVGCGDEYAPLERTAKTWRTCLECSPRGWDTWSHDHAGTCALCKKDTDKLIHPEISVCRRCAFDPEKREVLYKALLRKRRERRDAV